MRPVAGRTVVTDVFPGTPPSPGLCPWLPSAGGQKPSQRHACLLFIVEIQLHTASCKFKVKNKWAGEDVGKRNLCPAGGTANWCSHCGKRHGDSSSKNEKIELPYGPTIPLLGPYPKETQTGSRIHNAPFLKNKSILTTTIIVLSCGFQLFA